MRKAAPLLLLGALVLGGPSCAGIREIDTSELVADIAEFLGKSYPSRHVQRLVEIHDVASFQHAPDVPPTYAACLDEVRYLAESDYETWREVALSTVFVTRVTVEDQAALNRGEAARALVRLGRLVLDAEDPPPPDGAATEKEISGVIGRLNEIHTPAGNHLPPGPETAAECAGLARRLGDLRYEDAGTVGDAELRYRLKNLRGVIQVVVNTGLSAEDRGRDAQAGLDRSLINLAAQAVRLSLLLALRNDSHATVRAAAADALGRLRAVTAAPGLAAVYPRERDGAVRREIVQSLGELAATDGGNARTAGVPVLIAALGDDDRSVRFNAREALRTLAGEDLGEEPGPWIGWWSRTRSGS